MIHIIDSTLREGMQSTAGGFTRDQSWEVARLLARLGVDTIESGHPAISKEEAERVRATVDASGLVPVLAHARANSDDIDAVAETGAAWVGIFLGVNAISRLARLPGHSTADLYDKLRHSVQHARNLGLQVRFTVEDGGRTPLDELNEAYRIALVCGAERICFADTVGTLEPEMVRARVSELVSAFPGVDVEVHLHDDRGLATANALAAVDAGATWVSTSVNGLGERAGVVDLATLLVNLDYRDTRSLPAQVELVQELSRRVGTYSRSMPDHRRPVVGRDVFHHFARLHVKAVERAPQAYEGIPPERVGRTRSVDGPSLSQCPDDWIVSPKVISATELRYHRTGPGDRYVLVDHRFVPGCGQYCIARRIPHLDDYGSGHIDTHVHYCDSLFVFLGDGTGYTGLQVEVTLGDRVTPLESPASVFIPAGVPHSYRVVGGAGTYLNHVLAGDYNSSLLEPLENTS